jgi:hypothetical protein
VSGQLHAPAALPRESAPGTHWIGGWVDLRTGLNDVEKRKFLTLPGLKLRPLGRPARRYTDWAIPALGITLVIKEIPGKSTSVIDFIHCINKAILSSGTNEVNHIIEDFATSLDGQIEIHVNPILYRPSEKTYFSVEIQVMCDVHVHATS